MTQLRIERYRSQVAEQEDGDSSDRSARDRRTAGPLHPYAESSEDHRALAPDYYSNRGERPIIRRFAAKRTG